jgi:hypothetical protein
VVIYRITSIILFGLVSMGILNAQDMKQDIKEQVPIILKALNLNNTLKEKIKNDCVIAVLYNPHSSLSGDEKKSIVKSLEDNKKIKIHDKKIQVVEIPMDMNMNLEKQIMIKKINVFWLSAGLEAYANGIKESAKFNQVITISSDPALVTGAFAAMSTQKSENGYKLIINKNETNNIQLDLNEKLLSEAIIVE